MLRFKIVSPAEIDASALSGEQFIMQVGVFGADFVDRVQVAQLFRELRNSVAQLVARRLAETAKDPKGDTTDLSTSSIRNCSNLPDQLLHRDHQWN